MQTNMYFGPYGGRYVPDSAQHKLDELDETFRNLSFDREFMDRYKQQLRNFVGRPTPLLHAQNASKTLGGAQIYLKLEGLANTGAHKINNALGQAMLAKHMGKTRVVAETGAGQHGLATACVCAKLGLECDVYMGKTDVDRQRPNVFGMEQFGARVHPVNDGRKTLTEAVDAAIAEWAASGNNTYYLLGSALGPSPYPDVVRFFQSVIGDETKQEFESQTGSKPDALIACAGGGSNAIGFFNAYVKDPQVRLIAVEGGGKSTKAGEHSSRIASGQGSVGVHHGYKSVFLQDPKGELHETYSVSAGLDYAGIGPELANLMHSKTIEFEQATDKQVIEAFSFFARQEGILAALESSHALAHAMKLAPTMSPEQAIVVNVSGRGDKDIFITAAALDSQKKWVGFLKEEVARLENRDQHG